MAALCSYPGCVNSRDGKGGFGLCQAHYRRRRLGQDMDTPIRISSRGTVEERILRWLPEEFTDECYLWPKALHNGYPVVSEGGRGSKSIAVGRWVYERFVGPANGLHILHSCDRPACVNPRHLRPGTQQENVMDMIQRRRSKSSLSDDSVRAIRSDPRFQREIARDYGIARSTVQAIKARQNWAWLD